MAKRKKSKTDKWTRIYIIVSIIILFLGVIGLFLSNYKVRAYIFSLLNENKTEKLIKNEAKLEDPNTYEFYPMPIPNTYGKVYGIDVSRFQGIINWEAVAKSNIRFAIIKCTESYRFFDPYYNYNHIEAKKYGLLTGAYHFFRPRKSGKLQAEWFLSFYKNLDFDLPITIDIEESNGASTATIRKELKEFITIIKKELAFEKIIIYSGKSFYRDHLKGYFDDEILWIANYVDYPNLSGFDWRIWQYTDKGFVSGIKDEVDLNVFNGNLEELESLGD